MIDALMTYRRKETNLGCHRRLLPQSFIDERFAPFFETTDVPQLRPRLEHGHLDVLGERWFIRQGYSRRTRTYESRVDEGISIGF